MNLPKEVIDTFGYGIYLAQKGSVHPNAKVLQGFKSAGVIEIKESDNAGTYQAVYTIRMAEVVFVLHVFQKKSKQGIKTPRSDVDLIYSRLQDAQEIYKELFGKK